MFCDNRFPKEITFILQNKEPLLPKNYFRNRFFQLNFSSQISDCVNFKKTLKKRISKILDFNLQRENCTSKICRKLSKLPNFALFEYQKSTGHCQLEKNFFSRTCFFD